MAKKPSFPAKACPQCGKPIHIKRTKHEECGWGRDAAVAAAPLAAKKSVLPKRPAASTAGAIRIEDIAAVKAVVDRIGAEKVRDLARVLGVNA